MSAYPCLDICIFPTSIRIKMLDAMTAANGMSLSLFNESLTEFFFNQQLNKWLAVKKYAIYEESTKVASFPRYYLKGLVDYVTHYGGTVNMMHATTNPGRTVGFKLNPWWKPRPAQIPAIEFLVGANSSHHMRALPLNTGMGKGQPLNARIKVPGGWSTMGEMTVGTFVSIPGGQFTQVTDVYPQGLRDVYRITLENGAVTECDENHLWKIKIGGSIVVKQFKELLTYVAVWRISGSDALTVEFPVETDTDTECEWVQPESIMCVGKKETQCIKIASDDHLYITDDNIITHNTFSSLVAAATIDKATIIILNGLIDQWYDTIVTGRNGNPPLFFIDPKDVYVLQGQKSLVDLIEHEDYNPSFIIASLPTIRNYISANLFPYNELLPFGKLMERIGIGTKINDEAHRDFSAIVDVDLRSNINNNFYLSATLTRGDKQSKKIFFRVYPDIIRFDAGEIDKYIDVFYHSYNIGFIPESAVCLKKYGYNQNKYEGYILANLDKKIAFLELVNNYFASYYLFQKKPGHKCMIMAASRGMCDTFMYYFTEEYPQFKVASYFGGDNQASLVDADVIVTTAKKGGTGTDVDNLLTTINTMSIGSEVQPLQILGRLRKLKDGTHPNYVCMYNEVLDSHVRHYLFCRKLYRSRAHEYHDLSRKQF